MKKALGPLAVLNFDDCTSTATTETQKALGPLAVAERHILADARIVVVQATR